MSKKLFPHAGLGTRTPTELPASVHCTHMERINRVHMFTQGLGLLVPHLRPSGVKGPKSTAE